MQAGDVIHFWFEEISPVQQFRNDPAFDSLVRGRFSATHLQATRGELHGWRESAEGALAEVIVLDQFSRNIYRDRPEAFACDTIALVLAQEAIRRKLDGQLEARKRMFLYMPFMHSESTEIHRTAEKLFNQPGMERSYEFELKHKAIVDRFGRYPHRNDALGRQSTAEELEFLKQPGSSF